MGEGGRFNSAAGGVHVLDSIHPDLEATQAKNSLSKSQNHRRKENEELAKKR
jgi:hypothetical protein